MRKRIFYGCGIVLLAISVALVVWQGSFNFGKYGPADPQQTFIFWAISSLIFVLMVTLGFMLVRTIVKLYVDRRSGREGSRIQTKLVIGALALSITPALFLVLFSYEVLNRNLDKWFSQPAADSLQTFVQISDTLQNELRDEAELQAALLAAQPETALLLERGIRTPGFLERFAKEQDLAAAAIVPVSGDAPLDSVGAYPIQAGGSQTVIARHAVEIDGALKGTVELAVHVPINFAEKQREMEKSVNAYKELAFSRRNVRTFYLLFMAMITLFVLFVATWIALFLSKQISTPISALLRAAGEVSKGNLKHRVQVRAIDELASLVRGFNEMTHELEANSRELDARRRFTEAILESIPTGVISIGADGYIRRVNRALASMFSGAHVTAATRLEDLFSREDTAEIKYLMKRARRTGLASRQLEMQAGGRTMHLAVTVSALEEKLTSGFVIVLEDTSELLRAQKAAAWHEVARRVAHEIKNPLTPLALSAERMSRQLERLPIPPENSRILHECTDTISRSIESVKTLVDEFAQFARFPAAQPVRSDLNEVVERALAVFHGRLDDIDIRVQLAADMPPVNIDKDQFQRVVVNLVDNAAEAMQDSLVKRLLITTQPGAAESVELVIADTGCGISAEEKEKLFLPYFSTKGRGTGLGLAIVNHILADHGAHIRVEDNPPAGARFTIEIPALMEAENGEPALKPEAARA
ncbi:MAG TPA: ATP-binding protein [Bryobacteraceae bacterium]|nr:ATP-binding protein [Bryobacteraceae bacterium]